MQVNDDLNLRLSRLIDGDLSKEESIQMLDLIHKKPELRAKLHRYNMITQAIKSNDLIYAEGDFINKVSQKIKQESVVFVPAWRWKKQALAVAASIAIVVIIVFGNINSKPNYHKINQTLTLAKIQKLTNHQQQTQNLKNVGIGVDARFIEQLKAHDNGLYATVSSEFRPYESYK